MKLQEGLYGCSFFKVVFYFFKRGIYGKGVRWQPNMVSGIPGKLLRVIGGLLSAPGHLISPIHWCAASPISRRSLPPHPQLQPAATRLSLAETDFQLIIQDTHRPLKRIRFHLRQTRYLIKDTSCRPFLTRDPDALHSIAAHLGLLEVYFFGVQRLLDLGERNTWLARASWYSN